MVIRILKKHIDTKHFTLKPENSFKSHMYINYNHRPLVQYHKQNHILDLKKKTKKNDV
jgi:hypothetical protein